MGSLGVIFGVLDGDFLELQLTALEAEGKLNILSSPSLTTLDNHTAFTENGENVPFASLQETAGQEPVITVEFEEVFLRMEITPHVINGSYLKMEIIIKKDEVDFSRTVQGNPLIIKKQTETTLIVEDGETIVISGLSKQVNRDSKTGVPVLRDIPGLGYLFRGSSRDETMEEVLIFITPDILPTRHKVSENVVDNAPGEIPMQERLEQSFLKAGLINSGWDEGSVETTVQGVPEELADLEKPVIPVITNETAGIKPLKRPVGFSPGNEPNVLREQKAVDDSISQHLPEKSDGLKSAVNFESSTGNLMENIENDRGVHEVKAGTLTPMNNIPPDSVPHEQIDDSLRLEDVEELRNRSEPVHSEPESGTETEMFEPVENSIVPEIIINEHRKHKP